jgi:hypothetical protein
MFLGPLPGTNIFTVPRADRAYVEWGDAVLVHELLHGVQETLGVCSCASAGHNYDTFTEFCAITVENQYSACVPGRPVRRDHHGFNARVASDPNDPSPSESLRETDEGIMLNRFRALMPQLTNALEQIGNPPCRYNPFMRQRQTQAEALRDGVRRRPSAR